MTVREYMEITGKTDCDNFTFVIAKAVKDTNSPFYHEEYKTTPIRSAHEWLEESCKTKDYIVLNAKQPPVVWASVTGWMNWYNKGHLNCLLVSPKEEIVMHYGEVQGAEMIEMIDEYVRKQID
jgi:hypothetical protein